MGACSSTTSTKTAFCGYNITVDKSSSNVSSAADALTVLKANKAALDGLAKSIPNDRIRADAQGLVTAVSAAIASNDGSQIETQAVSTASNNVDLYCGVNH